MKNLFKSVSFLFAFNLIYWMVFLYITTDSKEDWNWVTSILISAGYATLMTYMFSQQMKNKQVYLAADQEEELVKYLKAQGYIEKKRKESTIFFKKQGVSFNPFRYTTIKSSPFYTLLVASESIVENIPKHLLPIKSKNQQ